MVNSRRGFKRVLRDPIAIETSDGFERVSITNGTCTCNAQKSGSCPHRNQVMRWQYNFNRYLALSALHKEIRRNDLARVKSWANIILLFQSPDSLLKYLERIVFEETRDVNLWIALRQKSISLNAALERITLVKKKWQLKYLNNPSHFSNWYNGFKKSQSRATPLHLEIAGLLHDCRNAEDAYSIYFDLRRDKSLRPIIVSWVHEVAEKTRNTRLIQFLKFKPSSSYEFMVLLELLIGLYEKEASALEEKPNMKELFVPADRNYYYDIHVSKGKALLKSIFSEAYQKRNFQLADLDLRFSGSLFSCLWRERCLMQFGSLKNKSGKHWVWTDVKIEDEFYSKALELEEHYYSSFIKEIKTKSPIIFLNSR